MSDPAFIEGRSGERAQELLKIAEELGHGRKVVKARLTGYEVPQDVAKAYAGGGAAPKAEEKPARARSTRKKKVDAEAEVDDKDKE